MDMDSSKISSRQVRVPSQARAVRKKKVIISAARDLFNHKPYNRVSIRMISAAAGVSIGTIYSYFRDKQAIFMEVRRRYRDELYLHFQEAITTEVEGTDSLKDAVYLIILTLRDFIREHRIFHRENLLLALSDEKLAADHMALERANGRAITELFFDKFGHRFHLVNREAAAFVLHRTIKGIVEYLILFGDSLSEEVIYRETARVITAYLSENES